MRVYISGPMTGKPDGNAQEFEYAAAVILAAGHCPVNPMLFTAAFGTRDEVAAAFRERYASMRSDYPTSPAPDQIARLALARAVMRADLEALKTCDAICLLDGWHKSIGAKHELLEALGAGLEVKILEDFNS